MDLSGSQRFLFKPYILAILLPNCSFILVLLCRKNVGFHSPGKKTLVFSEVADIDFVLQQFLPSLHPEVEPLQMTRCIAVYPHETIIFPLSYLENTVKVASFEE